MIDMVYEFNEKFGLPLGDADIISTDVEACSYRAKFMQEELDEFVIAMHEGDRVKAFDALLDLTYVVFGTALFMGVSKEQFKAGFDAVHKANMSKIRTERVEDSKRGSTFDVVKPKGWVPPEAALEEILK